MTTRIGSFDSVVLAAVAVEIYALVGGRVTRVGEPEESAVTLDLRAGGRTVGILCSIHPRWARIHLTAPGSTGESSPFGRMLRTRLDRARLSAVHQPSFERTLALRFDADTGPLDVVAEIMGRHSNLILVSDDTVVGALKPVPRSKSVREVLPGRPYVPPPHPRPTPEEITPGGLREILTLSPDPLAGTLSVQLIGLSPTLAREVAAWAAVDPDAPAAQQVGSAEPLWKALQQLVAQVRERRFDPVVYRDGMIAVGYAAFPLQHVRGVTPHPTRSMSEAIVQVMAQSSAPSPFEDRRAAIGNVVEAALERLARTGEDLRRALQEAEGSDRLREHGELLLAYASQIPPGATEATLPGYDGAAQQIPLDPALTPVENAQKLFARYAKIRRARPAIERRLDDAAQERTYLESAAAMLAQASSGDDLRALQQELAAGGYLRTRAPALHRPSAPRAFTLDGGASVLVGRSNVDNDRLTFHTAAPDDLWFHARGVPGAHVILRTGGRPATTAAIEGAAAIAAHFSQARSSGRVAVDYTERRHVRKPRGSRPGVVVYTSERTIQITPGVP